MNNTEWIFLGIGGTKSWNYHTCWTYEMYKEFSGKRQNSRYLHGPDDSGLGWRITDNPSKHFDKTRGAELKVGRSMDQIVNDASIWIQNCINDSRRSNKLIKIALVGHSRGGFAAILVAQRIQSYDANISIEFMGLFDAVKRTGRAANDYIPSNVKVVYHALRSWESRWSFGNTGTNLSSPEKTKYYEKRFNTSHGGVGGSPAIEIKNKLDIFEDSSDYRRAYKTNNSPRHGSYQSFDYYVPRLDRMIESEVVFHWIRFGAFSSGVPVSGIQINQRPVNRSKDTAWA